jgi:glycerophosphoryl diester phosphodiesterase
VEVEAMVEWISHRGLRNECSENSELAFDLAIEAGFRWLETDLRCTADGQIVLAHDPSLRRVFGKDLIVEKTRLREVELYTDPFNQKILKFSDFMQRYSSVSWVLDIKEESAEKTITALSKSPYFTALKERMPSRVKFLFWSVKSEKSFLRVFPDADTFAREIECWRSGVSAIIRMPHFGGFRVGKTYAIPPTLFGMDLYNHRIFSAYKRKSSKILAYLPETPALCAQAVSLGADYVLANSDFFNRE